MGSLIRPFGATEDRRSLTIVRLDAAKRAYLARRNHVAYRVQRSGYEDALTDAQVQVRMTREIATVPGIDRL